VDEQKEKACSNDTGVFLGSLNLIILNTLFREVLNSNFGASNLQNEPQI
jgi:hypothetical protein